MNVEDIRRNMKIAGAASACFDITYHLANRLAPFKVLQTMKLTMDTLDPAFLNGNEK